MREEVEADAIPAISLSQIGVETAKTFNPVPLGDEPGVYRVAFGQLTEGHYRARVVQNGQTDTDSTTTVAFNVRPYLGEQLDVKARPDIMARIASQTGGAVIDDAASSAVAEQFQQHISRSRPQRVRRLTAWDRWWVLLGVFTLWGMAWGLRRSGGLI